MPLSRRSNHEIRQIAADLLFKHGREEDVPVDVDELAEYDLNIKIETRHSLHAEKGIEGAISHDLRKIYLDDELFSDQTRWRSTVAHEIGHWALHAEFISSLPVANDEVLQTALLNIADADNDILEAEVQIFADALLVPDASLISLHSKIVTELNKAGRKIQELSPTSKEALAGRMARELEVTTKTVERRLLTLALPGWAGENGDTHLLPGFKPDA